MLKHEFVRRFFTFSMLDENDNIIYEKVEFNKLPFISDEDKNNLEILLKGDKVLVKNNLSDYYIKIYNIENIPKLSNWKEVVEFYKNDKKIEIEESSSSITLIETNELFEFKFNILNLSKNNNQDSYVECDFYSPIEILQPLVFLPVRHYRKIQNVPF